MIDSHCHLSDKKFDADRDEVIQRALDSGVTQMVCIADSLEEAEKGIILSEKNESIVCTAGVHPHGARVWARDRSEDQLRQLLRNEHVKAVGEIGLDYHYMNSPKEKQQEVFRAQLDIAKELNIPAVIHNRDSFEDLWNIVQEVHPQKAVLHCCTEEWNTVEQWIDAGYLLSFTGIATYPKSEAIRETISRCPLEKMMIETDAPYLAPQNKRGKRNEPAFVVEVAELISGLKNISLEEVDEVTTKNAEEFFSWKK